MRETHHRILLEQSTSHFRSTMDNPYLHSRLRVARPLKLRPRQVLTETLFRPTILLFRPTILLLRPPVLLIISLYVSLVFGVMHLNLTTFLPSGLRRVIRFHQAYFGTRIPRPRCRAGKQHVSFNMLNSEDRFLPMIWSSPSAGIGLIICGWMTEPQVHWIVCL